MEVVILLMTYLVEYVSNEIDNINSNVFNKITGTNESKTSTKHIPCIFSCIFDDFSERKNFLSMRKVFQRK